MSAGPVTFDLGSLFRALAPFDPTLVGTYPLGLQTEASDIDVACTSDDLARFEHATERLFSSNRIVPTRTSRVAFDPEASVVSFAAGGLEIELFCQALPVHRQHGFRHMIVEGRLLAIGGVALRDRVREKKREGVRTEPAFADVLGLAGDPYAALLALEHTSHEVLVALVERAAL